MKVICFDRDDTLYKEIDYLKSAYREIAEYACGRCLPSTVDRQVVSEQAYSTLLHAYYQGANPFVQLNSFLQVDLPIADYLTIYRNHIPQISLSDGVRECLASMKSHGVSLGLITDGRSVQQRHKIEALELYEYFAEDDIVISEEFGSEKPAPANFIYFMDRYQSCDDFTYVGDNLEKDFIAPNALGWKTLCLRDDGRNIHPQDCTNLLPGSLPYRYIASIVSSACLL